MIQLYQSIVEFLRSPVAIESVLCLPQQYPEPEAFEAFQAGYRYNAITGESVTGKGPGDFQESWYVICSNYFDDPFFVNFLRPELASLFIMHRMARESGRPCRWRKPLSSLLQYYRS